MKRYDNAIRSLFTRKSYHEDRKNDITDAIDNETELDFDEKKTLISFHESQLENLNRAIKILGEEND